MSDEDGGAAATADQQANAAPEADKADDQDKATDTGKKQANAGKKSTGKTDAKDPHGAERREFGEAYRNGIFQTDGPMAFLRDTTIKKLHIGDVYNVFGGGSRTPRSGSIREHDLVRIRTRYVAVPNYELMYTTLAERHLLVLHGQSGTGRLTTALRLLDELADSRVSRFDDNQEIEALAAGDFDKGGRGYVIELAGDKSAALTGAKLDKLRDLLGKLCYCVVIAELDELSGNSLDGYAFACEAPDQDVLLKRHIAEEVRADGDSDLERRLNELAAMPRLKRALGPAPRPAEIAEMARLLAEFGRQHIDLDEVESRANQLVQLQVVEWFSGLGRTKSKKELEEALRQAAFRIALAVFNKSPYHLVAQAGVDLAIAFIKMVSKADEPPSLFSDDEARRLPACRAEIVDGQLSFGQVRLPVGLAQYVDDRFPVVLLSYVWQHHHNLRAAMIAWLRKLSEDRRPTIWVRAAQATGLFCSFDFHFAYAEMIWPAATSDDVEFEQRRLFAAVALDQAARDERMTAAIRDRLRYWRSRGSDAEKWTAAATLGYDLGRQSIESTLEELRVLGTPSEQQSALDDESGSELVRISAYSLASLLAFGEVEPILQRLTDWAGSDRRSLRELAWWAMLYLIRLRGFDLDLLRLSAGRGDRPLPRALERWPLLLALQQDDPRFTKRIADLLRWGLRGRRGDFVAKYLFGPWIRAAENDVECLRALVGFVPHLIHDEADASRLGYLTNRLRHDWSDPLDDKAARLLAAAIRKEHHEPAESREASRSRAGETAGFAGTGHTAPVTGTTAAVP